MTKLNNPDIAKLYDSLLGRLSILEPGSRTAIVNVSIVDGLGNPPHHEQAVIVEDGVIAAITPQAALTESLRGEASIVEGDGYTLMPGLVDAHCHFTGHPPGEPQRRYLEANEDVRSLRAARDALLLLNAGFTSAKSMGHGKPGTVVGLKTALSEGVIWGPTIRHCGWALSQSGGHGHLPGWPLELVEARRPRSAFCDGTDGCRVAVRRNLGESADFIKIYATQGTITSPDARMHIPNFSEEEIRVMCDEARNLRTHVSAHSTGLDGSLNAVRAGVHTLEHGPCDIEDGVDELLDLMLQNGTILVPTLGVFSMASKRTTWPPPIRERAKKWSQDKQAIVRQAHERGVRIALGTDFSIPPLAGNNSLELELFVEAGLSPLDAIASATSIAAHAAGIGSRLGSVAVGMAADLLLVNGDPAESVSVLRNPDNIARIFKARYTWDQNISA